jgi:hypothetical protein
MRIDAPIITGSFSLNGDTFNDLGAYPSTGSNTFVGNQSIVGAVSASALTGSISYTNLTAVPTLVSGSEQIVSILFPLNSFTSSTTNRVNSLEEKTGSFATTGSNTFYGQQVFSGSLYVQDNLIVQGSSSLQNITASAVSIGTNIVYLNTDTPAVRFAGLTVQDSGSSAGVTGSMLWDSLCNRWIYSNPSTIGYSGGMLLSGPRTQTLGTEPTLTCNYVAKSGGGDHLYDSCIIDDGTTTCIKNNLIATGSITANGGFIVAGSPTGYPLGELQFNLTTNNSYSGISTLGTGTTTLYFDHRATSNTGNFVFRNGTEAANTLLTIAGTGAATFASSVTAQSGVFDKPFPTNGTSLVVRQTCAGGNGNQNIGLLVDIQGANDDDRIANFRYYDGSTFTSRMLIKRGGNVGIGIDNPLSALHMKGHITFSEGGYDSVRLHTITHSHSNGSSANNTITFNVSDGAGDGTTAERMRIDGAGALVVTGMVCSSGRFISNVGSTTSTYGFTHCGASRWGRFGMPNSSYMYLETNADSGVYIDAQTRIAGYLCSSSNIQGNSLLFSTSICGSGTKLGTGGANTSYVSDGLWGASATPNYISNAGGQLFRLGYWDNGSGLYGAAYGFDVNYRDGVNNPREYDAIVMRNEGQGTRPFRVTSYGNIYGVSKNFRIKHPLSSMNDTHYLIHTSIEGPQADLIYRGKVQLIDGKAEVNIDLASRMTDGTFEVLCQDVQSYTTNESGWSLTKSYVIGNILHIEAQDETATDIISWLVIGERNDDSIKNSTITDENGHVIVEELKPEEGL